MTTIYTPSRKRKKTDFNKLATVQKAKRAEKLVATLLEQSNCSTFSPRANKAHPIDLGIINRTTLQISFSDVKCYPCRNDGLSGVDLPDFHTYCKLAEQVPTSVLFVDSENRSVRQLKLTPEAIEAAVLDEKGEKVLWDYYEWTTPIFWLTWSQIENL